MVRPCGRVVLLLLLVITAGFQSGQQVAAEPHYLNRWAAEIVGGEANARAVAERYGFRLIRALPHFDDHYVLEHRHVSPRWKRSADHHTRRLTEHHQVFWAQQQVAMTRVKRSNEQRTVELHFNDPNFGRQWYMEESPGLSRRQREGLVHRDLRVQEVWAQGYTGLGVTVCVLDDGIESNHTDLKDNFDPSASTDLNGDDPDPTPRYDATNENKHGTRCAGEIAMKANNNNCGVGIAFNSNIGGVRMLDGTITDELESRALSFQHEYIDIYSASWGPTDNGATLEGPGRLAFKALEKGIRHGRGGKGVVYAWASGNGGIKGDNCNCDGYTSSIYTLSVSSVTQDGSKPWYGELCSSSLATTYSSGNYKDASVVSTDLHDRCTTTHSGTSASAPMAAGIYALLLEANPSLTWRDVQHLTVLTSKAAPLTKVEGWYQNAAGFCVHLAFGFGLLDAADLVTAGHPDTWRNVPDKAVCTVDLASNLTRPLKSGHLVEVTIETDGCQGSKDEVNFLEHVQLVVTADYSKRGALNMSVISPSGTETSLMKQRQHDTSKDGFQLWPLMSVHTWGETPQGVWRFRMEDTDTNGSESGALLGVQLVLHGTKEMPHYRKQAKVFCDIPADSDPVKPTRTGSKRTTHSEVSHLSSARDLNDLKHLLTELKDSERIARVARHSESEGKRQFASDSVDL